MTVSITQSLFGAPIVAFATDTVYGLGCLLGDQTGLDALYRAKNRPVDQPMQLLVADRTMAAAYITLDNNMPIDADSRLYHNLPDVFLDPRLVKDDKISVRRPDLSALCALIAQSGTPWIASSANKRGEATMIQAEAVRHIFPDVPVVLQSDQLSGLASSIWDMTVTPPRQLR